MNIIGHGVDLVDVASLQRWIDDRRDPWIRRCFAQEELDEIGDGVNRLEQLAGRFAAKEAVLKALGVGFGAGVAFTDVVTLRSPGEAPSVRLQGGAADVAKTLGISAWRLSISHAGGFAMASVIALG
jgi:holo-[acyl-carrier protein] synthase